jgi:lysophospholipase L1-like esterase
MTKRNNAIGILTILLLTAFTASAQSKPKVAFIGDQFTYNWNSAFAANPNWINQGWAAPLYIDNCYPYYCAGGMSGAVLQQLKTDVINLHPAIVHIMVGSDDVDSPTAEGVVVSPIYPTFLSNMQAMIETAKAANIQVILGIESPQWLDGNGAWVPIEPLNSIVATLAAQNDIPVINYADALCSCFGSAGGIGIGENFATLTPYMTSKPATNTGAYLPNPEGYALMTQMAEATINTLGLSLQGGYLQNVLQATVSGPEGPNGPKPNVTFVSPEAVIQFTPYGQYEGGLVEPLINSTYAGSTGTWSSSDPLVMYISQKGLATALSPGGVVITYKSPSGVAFNEWRIHVWN